MPARNQKFLFGFSLGFSAFLQSLGLFLYCSLIAFFMSRFPVWFGKVPNYFGPLLFLALFSTSALVCGVLTLGYPIYVFWEMKKTKEALKLVGLTALWSVFFVFLLLFILKSSF